MHLIDDFLMNLKDALINKKVWKFKAVALLISFRSKFNVLFVLT